MKVILATDGSEHAQEAARLLAHLPHSDKLELTVVYASNSYGFRGSMGGTELNKRLEDADKARAQTVFQSVCSVFEGANASLDLCVLEGKIATSIIHEAEARTSDLIVLGSVGHSMFERMLGSVSDYVASHAHCSVLVVRPTEMSKKKRPINLCFAHNEPEATTESIQQLAAFGWGAGVNIDIVGVAAIPFTYSEIPYEFDLVEIEKAMQPSLDHAADELRELSPNVQTHIIDGTHVGDALVEFAKKRGSDIVVLGNEVEDFLSRFLIGSTSRYVLRHAKCSVWIARKHTSTD